jgi:hypothetical protein
VQVQDYGVGLGSIEVLQANNAAVEWNPFQTGTNNAVTVTAIKVDSQQSSQVELEVTDMAGNSVTCDPVLTIVRRKTGQPEALTVSGLPRTEHLLSLHNGDPGLYWLAVTVNGHRFQLTHLKWGETRELDISSALHEGNNTLQLTAHGRPGGEATVLLHD